MTFLCEARSNQETKSATPIAAEVSPADPTIKVGGQTRPIQGVNNSSENDGIGELESGVSRSKEHVILASQASASHDEMSAEYMRRCNVKFIQLRRCHKTDEAMKIYDEFLSRPWEEVVAEPAEIYPILELGCGRTAPDGFLFSQSFISSANI